MNKIKLDLDTLRVQQFETGSAEPNPEGTVRAHATGAMEGCTAGAGNCYPDGGGGETGRGLCDPDTTAGCPATEAITCYNTCPNTCPNTCQSTCGWSVCLELSCAGYGLC